MPKMGPRYKVQSRRKREGRTDYRQRLNLLRSGKPRLVTRISLKHVTAQVVQVAPTGDTVLASAHSKQLEKFGWKASGSNVPASYLVGLLCGYRAVKAGAGGCTLDIGTYDVAPQAKVFAVLRGAIDAGLNIPHDGRILPKEDRITGKHISQYADKLKKEDPKAYQAKFSSYLARGIPPEQMSVHFNAVKQAIITQFS
ncbi:MAG TPA: 50S ribosomal protein L18 [Hadesarchaea archaeon]|nr:50S ribosomal protein L18 [Hadesarchaea archaeon]